MSYRETISRREMNYFARQAARHYNAGRIDGEFVLLPLHLGQRPPKRERSISRRLALGSQGQEVTSRVPVMPRRGYMNAWRKRIAAIYSSDASLKEEAKLSDHHRETIAAFRKTSSQSTDNGKVTFGSPSYEQYITRTIPSVNNS